MKRHFVAGLCGVATFVGAAVWMFAFSKDRVLRLPTGEVLQIRDVSLGTQHPFDCEPVGKRILRSIIPDGSEESALGPSQRVYAHTTHESLLLWVIAYQSNGAPATLQDPEALLANGVVAKGNLRTGQKLVAMEFPSFARENASVPLRVRCGSSHFDFVVNNPRPARPANWTAHTLPQTNNVAKTAIALKKLVAGKRSASAAHEYGAYLQNCAQEAATGWTRWRITAFDRWGNYGAGNYNDWFGDWGGRPSFQFLPPETGPWRLEVKSEEYLSAGEVPYPEKQLFLLLPPTARMQELGIRFLMLVGDGAYSVSNGTASRTLARALAQRPRALLSFSPPDLSGGRSLTLETQRPGVLCILDTMGIGQRISTRLREQSREKGALIFDFRIPIASATNAIAGQLQIAQFFASGLPLEFKKPMELEVISEATTEFFVNPN